DRVSRRIRFAQLVHRNEFKENVMIEDQAQEVIAGIFEGDEAFGAAVNVHETHIVTADLLAEQLAIGIELHTAMHDESKLRPDIDQAILSRNLLETVKEDKKPRRHATGERDGQPRALLGKQADLLLPVGAEGNIQRRKTIRTQVARHFAGDDAAEIAS